MRNVEIKAILKNFEEAVEIAKKLSGSLVGTTINQHDIFFNSPQGRLKLRQFQEGNAELIYYERPDTEGPKLSSYEKSEIPSKTVKSLSQVLDKALGVKGEVRKTRLFFLIDQTRVHLDKVDNLGNFIELEVVLKPEQSLEDGQKIADNLMKCFQVESDDLLAGAYFDMLKK